jgi:recombination protein RecT
VNDKQAPTTLQVIKRDIQSARERFESVAIDKSVSFEREAGFAMQILGGNDYLCKIALSNKASMLAAVVNIAAIGISLNPAKRQAYLVPRDGKVCLDISYMGLLDLAIQSGAIRWGQAELVYAADKFTLNGVDQPPNHERDPFAADRGDIIGAYVVVKTEAGDYLTTAMSTAELFDIRGRSSAWQAWVEKKKRCPWVTDEGEMMKKTVIKRAYKTWPKTDRLDPAVDYLNTEAGEGIEFASQSGGAILPTDGALDSISEDQLERVREIAEKVRKGYASLGPEAAAQYIADQEFDADELTALWTLFGPTESAMRAAIKSAQAAERLQA